MVGGFDMTTGKLIFGIVAGVVIAGVVTGGLMFAARKTGLLAKVGA
jgi:hypothetical protein